jgi:alkylation response protein AidB-like acyl-CoA dehydrogenase
MDFELTGEQHALRRRVERFAATLGTKAAEHDRDEVFDADGWQALAEFGVAGWPIPTEYGGAGLDPLSTVIACEALGYGCPDNGLVFVVDNHLWACVIYVLRHGTAEQKARFLPGLADGSKIGGFALTEPGTGSDVLAVATTATREAEGYRLDGTKCYISNGPVANLFVVIARTADASAGQRSLSAFLVPADTPGLRVVRSIGKAGLRGTLMGELEFADCVVPAENLLGGEGGGYQVFTSTIEWERGFMAAPQVGRLRRILETCVAYVGERQQFGHPIGSYQAVAHRLADMQVHLELARLLLYKVGWLKQQGRVALLESAMLKLFVSESLVEGALSAVRTHGARGYVTDLPIERELRDAVGTVLYGGTSDIQRNVIARLIGVPEAG